MDLLLSSRSRTLMISTRRSTRQRLIQTHPRYDLKKAAQMIVYMAMRSPQRSIDPQFAAHLLYLADCENIRRCGEPMLCEPRMTSPIGPVNAVSLAYATNDASRLTPAAND